MEELLFITYLPYLAKYLADELLGLLHEQHCPARVLKYGVLFKGQSGFLVLACPSPGFPAAFFDSIQRDSEVTGYALITSQEQAGTAETEAQA